MVDYKWHKHQLEAKKREIREKAELKSKKAHFKRKKAEYEAKYGISFESTNYASLSVILTNFGLSQRTMPLAILSACTTMATGSMRPIHAQK